MNPLLVLPMLMCRGASGQQRPERIQAWRHLQCMCQRRRNLILFRLSRLKLVLMTHLVWASERAHLIIQVEAERPSQIQYSRDPLQAHLQGMVIAVLDGMTATLSMSMAPTRELLLQVPIITQIIRKLQAYTRALLHRLRLQMRIRIRTTFPIDKNKPQRAAGLVCLLVPSNDLSSLQT